MSRTDGRLQEMLFLARVEREGGTEVSGANTSIETSMVISMLHDGYLNGIESVPWDKVDAIEVYMHGNSLGNSLSREFEQKRWNELARLLSGKRSVKVQISHKGRVRLAELEQQIQTGRERERFGILLSGRHIRNDLTIALFTASTRAPVSVAYLDMNNLKPINDTYGHAVADDVIRSYLGVIATFTEGDSEAYRVYDGGDEVVVIMRSTGMDNARKLMSLLLRQLENEQVRLPDNVRISPLTASCGIVVTEDPNHDAKALVDLADAEMKRAKEECKKHTPRVSAIAIGEDEVATLPRSQA